jgi:hypothetical protein
LERFTAAGRDDRVVADDTVERLLERRAGQTLRRGVISRRRIVDLGRRREHRQASGQEGKEGAQDRVHGYRFGRARLAEVECV